MPEQTTDEAAIPFDVDALTRLGRVAAVAPAPDGTWLAVAVARLNKDDAAYVHDLWRVSLAGDGADPIRLTRAPSNDQAPCFRADGSLGFLSDRKTGEEAAEDAEGKRSQVWLLPAQGGEPRRITDEPLGVSAFRFAGERLVVLAPVLPDIPHDEQREAARQRSKNGPSALHYRQAPVRYWDHWLPLACPHLIAYDTDGGARRDLTPTADREHLEADWDVSADGAVAVLCNHRYGVDRVFDVALDLIDLESGAVRSLGRESRVALIRPLLSADGKQIACVREQRFERACPTETLWLLDSATGEGRAVAESWDRWPTPVAWSADGAAVIVSADDRGASPLFRVDCTSGDVSRIISEESGGSHHDIHRVGDTDRLVGIRHTHFHPPEPFAVDGAPGASPVLLGCLSGFTPEQGHAIAVRESFEVEAADGVKIQSYLLKPNSSGREPPPVVLWIHGGPISHWGDSWHWRWSPLVAVAAGYAIALPNPRGSTGFGHDFIAGIWGNTWGGACYDELMRVTDTLVARDDLDGQRVGAMGGSFGGYMANWIGTNTDRFRCLVTHASLWDLSAFYGVTDVPGWFAMELGGTPYEDGEAFDRYSPHRLARNWKSPTLVIHGEKDYRVPVGEGLALFDALQLHGVDSELLVFPDENHWILKPRNARVWYRTVFEFLGRHLGRP